MAPSFRWSLWLWFRTIRGSIKGSLPLAVLLGQAKTLRLEYMLEAAKTMQPVRAPIVNHAWLKRWMREFHVSLRTPNKHYKVPKAVFLERVCITWENLLRLRQWCLLHTGEDPEVDGFDQKPFHMNEAGSKRQKTLSFKGIQVELRQGHSATRERWTATTYTTSDLLRAAKPLPLEV